MFEIKVDPSRMSNPDLDLRYGLFDYLDEQYPGLLQDEGFDFEGQQPLLLICIGVVPGLTGLQCEAILDSIISYDEFGSDFKNAIEVRFEDGLLYPPTD